MRRILSLARRTGDRVIVTDPEGNEAFVLLSLDAYEALLGQKPTQRAPQPPVRPAPPAPRRPIPASRPEEEDGGPPPDIFDLMAAPGKDTWNLDKMDESELHMAGAAFEESEDRRRKLRRALGVDSVPQVSAKDAVSDKAADVFAEEQFYLEPLE